MAKFKVYYTIELNEIATHIFESNDFEVKLCSHNDEETYVKELAAFQPDAIMCRTEPITAKMMDTCTNLKVIGKQGAGLDNIDMDHAHAKDITVVYAPAGNANAVAEHAVMLMLMCAKRFTYVDRQFRGGNFLVRMDMEHTYELGGKTLGDALLAPTKIYVKPVLKVLEEVDVKGISHITGGGFYENIPRSLKKGCCARINKADVRTPALFHLMQKVGGISEHDMFNTFNMGVGMVLTVPAAQADKALEILHANGEPEAYKLGVIAEGDGVELC